MRFLKTIVIISLPFIVGVASAKCLPNKDKSPECRYEKGDSWCAQNDNKNPYAYSDSCLSKNTKKNEKPTADVSGLKALRQSMNYSEARKIILDAGWQGNNTRWQDVSQYGQDNDIYHNNGWHEVQSCAGTGTAPCRFEFHDIHNNMLVVITEGECSGEGKCDPGVSSWSLE